MFYLLVPRLGHETFLSLLLLLHHLHPLRLEQKEVLPLVIQ